MNELAVIVPTRSRPQNVLPILTAWAQTSAWSVADLWWVVDADDARLAEYHRALGEFAGPFKLHIRPEWEPMVPKLNGSAVGLRKEFGYRNIAFMGDDHVPRTPMWAHMLIEDHLQPCSGIVYGQDGFQNQSLPTWWSMDGRIIDRLGRMVPAPVQHLYCDNSVKALGELAGQLRYDSEILIEHMHPIVGKATMDAQYQRVNRREQYARDEVAFIDWMASGLDADATLLTDLRGGDAWRSAILISRATSLRAS